MGSIVVSWDLVIVILIFTAILLTLIGVVGLKRNLKDRTAALLLICYAVVFVLFFLQMTHPEILFRPPPVSTINILERGVQNFNRTVSVLELREGEKLPEVIITRELLVYQANKTDRFGRTYLANYSTITITIENPNNVSLKNLLIKESIPEEVAKEISELVFGGEKPMNTSMEIENQSASELAGVSRIGLGGIRRSVKEIRFVGNDTVKSQKKSIVVQWIFDNLDPGQKKTVNYTVEKQLTKDVLANYTSPDVIAEKAVTPPPQPIFTIEKVDLKYILAVIVLIIIIVVIYTQFIMPHN
ncbi:hypothetical protein HY991_04765 [Candidatus Micrarchaeota archaeon]|nr:hypothetical protein [Candidatus Micrarchaeota archaeon]